MPPHAPHGLPRSEDSTPSEPRTGDSSRADLSSAERRTGATSQSTARSRLAAAERSARRGLSHLGLDSRADLLLVLAVALWLGYTAIASLAHGGPPADALPFLIAPVVILAGVAAGRVLASRSAHVDPSRSPDDDTTDAPAPRRGVTTTHLSAAVALVAGLALLVPFYANAQAAFGLQLVALAGLLALSNERHEPDTLAPTRVTHLTLPVPTLVAVVLGVLLAGRAQAAGVLVVVLALVLTLALVRRDLPSRRRLTAPRTLVIAGGAVIAVAAALVTWLGGLSTWPTWLSTSGSLSGARHALWADALELWSQRPQAGSGPGSFVASSPIAASRPDLSEVHSSVLQVAAELGLVGVLMLAGLLAAGLAVGAQRGGRAALVATTAWTALAVHSMIDHLYEFPPVTLAAGLVLGWASAPHHRPA
ncbi:O-antigen ligase family protein [Georgenia sp. Z1344]|uniref:O-antigen ligase family protein n=1 Tax=Georgenia sp. Z1344 TaxID=3416706 RepID=UPI003CF2A569